MGKILSLLLLSCCAIAPVLGQYYEDKDISVEPRKVVKRYETETWKTAFIAPERELHLSLVAPMRYGLSPSVELQSYMLLWAYLTPNIYVKKNWYAERWLFSSKHGVYYPTWGLERLKDDGRDNTLNENAEVPSIFTFQNEFIASYVLNPTCNNEEPYWIATGRLGADISMTGNREDSFNRMTFYSFYHRTASFYGDQVLYAGLQLDGGFLKKIYFNIGADVYAMKSNLLAGIEAQSNVIYHYNRRLSFSAGVKFIKTDNPIEGKTHIFPMIDVCYRLGRNGGWEKGLFGKKKRRRR